MKLFTKDIKFNLGKALLIIFILAIFSTIFQTAMQNGIDMNAYIFQLKNPLIILFNFMPIFLLITLMYFITSSISFSFIIINLPLLILLIINHYKIYFLDMPLATTDLFVGHEAMAIAQNYKLSFNLKICILSILMLIIFAFLAKHCHTQKQRMKVRIIGTIFVATIIGVVYVFIYSDNDLYENVAVPSNIYYSVVEVNEKGLLYSLLSKSSPQLQYTEPEGYSDDTVQKLIEENSIEVTNKEMPNVIAIMSEAFYNPEKATNLKFYSGKNPLTNFNKLKKEGYYGNIIVPGFAGATASTEFEFLTGINISSIDKNMPNVYKTHITSKIYSLVNIFKNLGYSTLAIHPGERWFYNRENVYRYMEFDNMIFNSELPKDVEKVNYYVSDNVTADLIIDNYKKHLEENPNKKYFNFTITIQNHGPYMDNETDRGQIVIKPNDMDDKLYNIVNNYMLGLKDADNLLGKVTEYAKSIDTPTVVVFFGDHLPFYDSELEAYEEIGYPITDNTVESVRLKHSTPYLIWGNKAAKDLIKANNGKVLKGNAGDISSSYLGLKLLKYMNMDLPPFYNFLSELEKCVPIITQDYYYVDKKYENELPSKYVDKLQKYKIWEYYNLKRFN